MGEETIKALKNEKCKRDPRRDELSYSFWTAIDVTFRARKRRSTSRDRHSDKKHLIMASCIIFFPNVLFPHMSPNTPIPFRQFSSHWTLSRPFAVGSLTDGRARSVEDTERRRTPRRCASRRITIRTGTPSSVRETSATLRHPGSPLFHSPTESYTRAGVHACVCEFVRARSSVCVPHPFVSVYVYEWQEYPYRPRRHSNHRSPATDFARAQGWSGVYDRVRERTRG